MLKGFVSGEEKDIKRIPMKVGNEYKEGWEVRDNQDRLIWGREDELQTATDTLTFKGYSLPLKLKSLLGNAVQNGAPAPDNIVLPEMCGVRTGNLFNKSTTVVYNAFFNEDNKWIAAEDSRSIVIPVNGETQYTLSIPEATNIFRISEATQEPVINGTYPRIVRASSSIDRYTFTTQSDTKYIIFQGARALLDTWFNGLMLNTGSTALPYEPFGYKIPLTCAEQTTPVYLGEVPTVRRVRKLVLTGDESDWRTSGDGAAQIFNHTIGLYADLQPYALCNTFYQSNNAAGYNKSFDIVRSSGNGVIRFNNSGIASTTAAWKSYLAAQYAAGTPVTVWYVLATPETAIVNEPLAKIGDYADELNDTVATLPEIPTTTGQNTLTVDTTLAPSSLTVEVHAKKINYIHYGFKIDKSNDNSEDAVIYTHDAVTMTPAYMDFTNDRFDYGSWGDTFFVRDCYPVALNLDGTEAYRLDPDDYTKKIGGTPSDIFYELLETEPSDWSTQWKQYYTKSGDEYELNSESTAPTFTTETYYKLTYSSSFTGNFMMAFPKVWFYRHEDSQYNYIEISDHKLSDDWRCYAHINANGQEVDFIYLPLFKGVIKDSKLRSLPGQIPQGDMTTKTEERAATALGPRWQFWDHSSVEYLNDLLTLMSKSIDSQGRFGLGRSASYDSTDTVTYGKLQTGTLIKKGKFHGYSATPKEVKVFGLEGFWGNRFDRVQGMLLVENVWKIKMTPPYNFTGEDFVTLSNAEVPSGNGYLSKVQTSEYGSIPASIANGSSTKYFRDNFTRIAYGTRITIRGGSCYGIDTSGFRNVRVDALYGGSGWGIGASPVYK